jgi:hypothetical protein
MIPMKFKISKDIPERSTKNLPVKLTFTVANPTLLQNKIVAGGGSKVEGLTAAAAGVKEGTLYAKDPEGYLLELIPGGTSTTFTSIGYGSSNITASAAFFGKIAGSTPSVVVKNEAWDSITVSTKKPFKIQFIDFRDGRPTKKLPLKIVWGVPSIPGFKSTITAAGGALIPADKMGVMAAMVGLGYDSVDQIMIEINSGG